MQSARVLRYGDAHHVETAASLEGHGGLHGRGNIDFAKKEAAFSKSIFQKYLNMFPSSMRVPAAVATLSFAGIGLFNLVKAAPAKNITRNKEWERATAQRLKDQRVSIAHKKSG